MPNLDKTGPQGQGQKTGWGRGGCAGKAAMRGAGAGMGLGRCEWRQSQDMGALVQEREALQQELAELKERISQLEAGK